MTKPPVAPVSQTEFDPSVNLLLEKYKLLCAGALENSAKTTTNFHIFKQRLIPLSPGARDVVSGVAARQMFL